MSNSNTGGKTPISEQPGENKQQEIFVTISVEKELPPKDTSKYYFGISKSGSIDVFAWDRMMQFFRPYKNEENEMSYWLKPVPLSSLVGVTPIPSDIIAFRDSEAEKSFPFTRPTDIENLDTCRAYNFLQETKRSVLKLGFDLCHKSFVVPLQLTIEVIYNINEQLRQMEMDLRNKADELQSRIAELEAENEKLKKANL